MKITLTEEEKNRILGLHNKLPNSSSNNSNTLINEVSGMFKMMNLPQTKKINLLNEGVNPTVFREVLEKIPYLKPLIQNLDEKAFLELAENLGKLSDTLANKGVNTIDDLVRVAKEFAENNKSQLKVVTTDESALIYQFLQLNKNILEEFRIGIQKPIIDAMNANTTRIFAEIEQTLIDVDSEVGGSFFDDMEKFTQVTDDTFEGLEKSIDDIDSTVKIINETIEEFEEKVKNLGSVKPNTPEAELLAKYNRYLSGLKKMKLALEKRKTSLTGLKETASMDINKMQSDVIEYKGKVYNVANMNGFQKGLLKIGLDHWGPLFWAIVRFVVNGSRFVALRTQLLENITKLKDLSDQMRFLSTDEITTDFKTYISDTSSLIEQINGKYFRFGPGTNKNFKTFLKEIWGGKLKDLADIQTIWKEITGILEQEVRRGNLTQDEASKILQGIYDNYAYFTDGGQRISPDAAETFVDYFQGLAKMRNDFTDVAKETGYDLSVNLKAPVEGIVKKDTRWMSNYFTQWWKAAGAFSSKGFLSALGKVFLRDFLIGLPLNVRYYLKPFAKSGFGLRGALEVFLRLSAAKALSTIVFGGIGAYVKYLSLKFTVTGAEKSDAEIENIAWSEWNETMSAYKNLDFGQMLKQVAGFDFSKEMGKNEITGDEYIEQQNAQFGILRFNIYSFIMEFTSTGKAIPNISELEEYMKDKAKQEKKLYKEDIREKLKNYENLYYSFDEAKQMEISNEDGKYKIISSNMYKLDGGLISKMESRFFMKMIYAGESVLDVNNIEAVKKNYVNINNYRGYACICKTNLKYDVKPIQIGNETKTAEIPLCDDYVRLVNFFPTALPDYSSAPLPLRLKYDGKMGFIDSENLKNNSYKDWQPLTNLKLN